MECKLHLASVELKNIKKYKNSLPIFDEGKFRNIWINN